MKKTLKLLLPFALLLFIGILFFQKPLLSIGKWVGKAFTARVDAPFGIKMIAIEGGTFNMGNDEADDDSSPMHSVTISDFEMSETEITQAQWKAVMGNNPSYFSCDQCPPGVFNCDQCPVERVSRDDAELFIQKLNALTGAKYRLPTEAEWEYAAGGGANGRTKYAGTNNGLYDDDIFSHGWYDDNSDAHTHPVKMKKPNALGLYDMGGNVWEWCIDWYDAYPPDPQINPIGPPLLRGFGVFRGGSWWSSRTSVTYRFYTYPDFFKYDLGFRIANKL